MLTPEYFWKSYYPKRVALLIILGLPFAFLLAGERGLGLMILLLGLSTAAEYGKFIHCKTKHEKLVLTYGDKYLAILEKEIEQSGLDGLIKKYWLGLEPK